MANNVFPSDAVILCYGVDCRASFVNCDSMWRNEIQEYVPGKLVVTLVGCKGDIVKTQSRGILREVSIYDGQRMAKNPEFKRLRTLWGECSAKTGANVESIFRMVAEKVLSRRKRAERKRQQQPKVERVNLQADQHLLNALLEEDQGHSQPRSSVCSGCFN